MNSIQPQLPHQHVSAFFGWILAIGLALGLNLFLFGIMPGLIQRVPQRPEVVEDIRTVQVVRVKRPETPPRKKEKTKPPKPKESPKPMGQLARQKAPNPARVKPRLPFELNPGLPSVSDSLVMPPLSQFSMNVPAPKGLYLPSELDAPLTAMAKVPPLYPLRASRLGIEGWVKIRFRVTREGRVEQVKILGAEPEGIFENAVVNCVSQWRFRPGTVDGVAVVTQAETIVRFQLEDE